MAKHGNDPLVIYGISQGSVVATVEKRKLAEQYPEGTTAPDIDFVMHAHAQSAQRRTFFPVPGPLHPDPRLDVQRPRADRHPIRHGCHQPAVRRRRRFPVVSDQCHRRPERVAGGLRLLRALVTRGTSACLPIQRNRPLIRAPTATPSYYFFENPDLPLFGPLRTLGVPESLIDVFEPFFRVIVETGL